MTAARGSEAAEEKVADFLSAVIERKRAEVTRKMAARPADSLRRGGPAPEVRNFREAIAGGGIIAEIKRRSPTVSSFRQSGSVGDLASTYERCGASAISVVTDEPNFGTSLEDVGRAREAASLPVLAKDFVVDGYQVAETWAAGADALLLIARILPVDRLGFLLDMAHELGVSALVECHTEEDIAAAEAAGAGIIGINNRDLATLEVSVERTPRLAPLAPEGACVVCESGIRSRGDILRLREFGVRAFLVGGALLASRDPGKKLRELLGRDDEKGRPDEHSGA